MWLEDMGGVTRGAYVTRGSAMQSGKQDSRSLQQSVAGAAAGEPLPGAAEMHCDVEVERPKCEEGQR